MLLRTSRSLLVGLSCLMTLAASSNCWAESPVEILPDPPPVERSPAVLRGFPAGAVPGPRIRVSPIAERSVRTDVISRVDPALPDEAQRLVTQLQNREAAIRARLEAELQPEWQQVIQQLQALQDRFTREGKLDEAVAVRAQVRALRAKLPGVLPDPGSLMAYRGQNGKSLMFHVVGSLDGVVYGNGTYTDDSDLATAVVHAGLVRPGESIVVRVTILPGQDVYEASTRHGVTTYGYRSWSGSYRVESADLPKVVAQPIVRPQSLETPLTDSIYGIGDLGNRLRLRVKGSLDGYVWGNSVYTDDSSLGTAAVHAGLLKNDEVGFVTIRILPGQSSYGSVTRNGVTTREYASWARSFEFVPNDLSIPVMRTPSVIPSTPATTSILPDPGTLMDYRSKVGQTFLFHVTGSADGFVYGTDTYTDDSTLATAVVHAGIVKPGERTVVKVTIVEGQDSYQSSNRNGIESRAWGNWSTSYRVQNYGYPVRNLAR